MNPLSIAAGVVSLLSEMVAREYRKAELPHWPDGEAPIDDRLLRDGPEVWATMPQQVSAGSAIEARVDAPVDEVPTPGRAHTPGVGHPNITASLLISASIGLRDYADSDACEAPVYWNYIADQLDPKK